MTHNPNESVKRYEKLDILYHSRLAEVEQINSHAYDRRNSAMRRDRWLYANSSLTSQYVLTEEQLKEIEDFWAPYSFAYQNDPRQQAFFSAITGKFDPSYFGFGMQRYYMVRFWNHQSFSLVKQKNYTPLFFHGVKMPETYIYNENGYFFDGNRDLLSREQAVKHLMQCIKKSSAGEAIIKPSDGGEGKEISFITKDMSREEVTKILTSYHSEYICQQVVRNHSSFSALYPGSLNTLRMITLHWKDTFYFVGAVLRMGTSKRVDNWSQGGLACGVNPDGTMHKYAFYENGELAEKHPVTGVVFENHKLPKIPEAIELVKKLHSQLPQQKYISWDITVDDEGDLMMIELNSPGSHELVQMTGANGYVNREIAKEIFDEYLIKRFFYEKATFDWNYREFSDHISLREYCGLDSTIHVPSEINGKKVRLIYENAFRGNAIKKVVVPSSVIVHAGAFRNVTSKYEIIRIDV